MKIHIVMHESFEAPAAIEAWAKKKGCDIAYIGETNRFMLDSFKDCLESGGWGRCF